ncbi:response regulator transcription factor [Paraburkholderia sp. B3]|uniref:helix-turn-helix transcriptional regulator n=1 Tax=Paraburkholderia sp. B3 TaxID=3134791 RepID=UPI0039825823
MHEPDGFLLSLHAAAREVPVEAFQEHALNLLRQITALNLDLPDLFGKNRSPGLLNYVHRYGHIQALIIGRQCGEAGMHQAISLYRAREDKPFAEAQRRMLEVVFPHLTEALQTSMAFHMERIRPRGGEVAWSLAICDTAGEFRFAEPGFCDLLRVEWPSHAYRNLPTQLAGVIGGGRKARFQGRAALFVIEVVHDVVFVRARVRVPVDALSPRELEVAKLVVAGLTHKEIAKALALAPATVRNHLQAIHERAGVHTNAELVQQLRHAGV